VGGGELAMTQIFGSRSFGSIKESVTPLDTKKKVRKLKNVEF